MATSEQTGAEHAGGNSIVESPKTPGGAIQQGMHCCAALGPAIGGAHLQQEVLGCRQEEPPRLRSGGNGRDVSAHHVLRPLHLLQVVYHEQDSILHWL